MTIYPLDYSKPTSPNCLPAEQGTALVKSIEAAWEAISEDQKDVPAGTFSVVTDEFVPDSSEPFAVQRPDALALMAESLQSSDVKTRNGGEWLV